MDIVHSYFLSNEKQEGTWEKRLMDGFLHCSQAEFNGLKNTLCAAAFSRIDKVSPLQMLERFTLLLGETRRLLCPRQGVREPDRVSRSRLQALEIILSRGVRHHRTECRKSQLPVIFQWKRPAFELVALLKSLLILGAVTLPTGQGGSECTHIIRLCNVLGTDISESTVRNLRHTANGSIRQDTLFKDMAQAIRKWLNEVPLTKKPTHAENTSPRSCRSVLKSPL